MKALSIRQPWAWAIIHAGKDIENRTWKTNYRGPLLIHASKNYDRLGDIHLRYNMGIDFSRFSKSCFRGGIIGMVDLVDCVEHSDSPWKDPLGCGFVLKNPRPLVFAPMPGRQGLFEVREALRLEHD